MQQGKPEEAVKYAEQALNNDRYNSNALVNSGNVKFLQADLEGAREFYREALANEATCVEALYNQGMKEKQLDRIFLENENYELIYKYKLLFTCLFRPFIN